MENNKIDWGKLGYTTLEERISGAILTYKNGEKEFIKMENKTTDGGDDGKTRHDLVLAFAQEQYARVLTAGANKYGDNNWKRGQKWSVTLASMKRHIIAIENGEDYDKETGILHAAHIMCNAAFLTEYYKIYPQGDDRRLTTGDTM